VHANPALAIRVHINQELGVNPEDQPSPWVAAGSSFLCFGIGALVPLIPYLLGLPLLFVGLAAGAVGLFLAGALTSRFTTRSWWLGGLRQIGFGAIAAVATYLIGVLIGAGAG
jgi:VIT1/CCC1 family predicted Fe2+/Mn2+ transporter